MSESDYIVPINEKGRIGITLDPATFAVATVKGFGLTIGIQAEDRLLEVNGVSVEKLGFKNAMAELTSTRPLRLKFREKG